MTAPGVAPARGGDSWSALAEEMSGCVACPLSQSRTRVVPGVHPPGARVLLVGEAPGRAEDEGGLPFIGRSGRLLDELLAAVGIDRAEAAVVNTVKCRPPGNRTPHRREAATCRPWLDRQVAVVDPVVIVTLGGSALAWALGAGNRLGAARGRVHRVRLPAGTAGTGRHTYDCVPTYHPAAALRSGPAGAQRAALATDLRLVARLLSDTGAGGRESAGR